MPYQPRPGIDCGYAEGAQPGHLQKAADAIGRAYVSPSPQGGSSGVLMGGQSPLSQVARPSAATAAERFFALRDELEEALQTADGTNIRDLAEALLRAGWAK